ncbi:MAG TPA: hypothetical protein VGF04_08920 [Solirubrobacterales bacterium]
MPENAGETQELRKAEETKRDWSQHVKEIGGLLAVVAGLLAIAGIAAGAFIAGSQTAATVAGSATAVVGSIVGAYLGVKIGTDQTRNAIQGQREEAAKGQVYAAHMAKEEALKAVPLAQEAAEAVRALK